MNRDSLYKLPGLNIAPHYLAMKYLKNATSAIKCKN